MIVPKLASSLGRKPKSLTRANAMRRLTQLLPRAIIAIEETCSGVNKDRLRYEAAIEIKNTCLGKPRIVQEVDITGGGEIGAVLMLKLIHALSESRLELESNEPLRIEAPIIEGEATELT